MAGKQVTIKNDGLVVGFFGAGIEAALKNRNAVSRKIFPHIDKVIENAVYYSSEVNTKDGRPGVAGYDTYYSAAIIDGKPYSVRIVIDVIKDNARGPGYYYHQVKQIDVENAVGYSRALKAPALTTSIDLTLDQLTENVKPESSKTIDANGEPLVVYHGTDKDFESFKTSNECLTSK